MSNMEKNIKNLDVQIEDFFIDLHRKTRENRYRYTLQHCSITARMLFYCFRNNFNFNNVVVRVKTVDKICPEEEYDIIGHNESDRLLFVPIVVKYLKDKYFSNGGTDVNFEPKTIQEDI